MFNNIVFLREHFYFAGLKVERAGQKCFGLVCALCVKRMLVADAQIGKAGHIRVGLVGYVQIAAIAEKGSVIVIAVDGVVRRGAFDQNRTVVPVDQAEYEGVAVVDAAFALRPSD